MHGAGAVSGWAIGDGVLSTCMHVLFVLYIAPLLMK